MAYDIIDIDAQISKTKSIKVGGKTYSVGEPSAVQTAKHNKRLVESVAEGSGESDKLVQTMIQSLEEAAPDIPKTVLESLPNSAMQRLILEIYDTSKWPDDSKNSQPPGKKQG